MSIREKNFGDHLTGTQQTNTEHFANIKYAQETSHKGPNNTRDETNKTDLDALAQLCESPSESALKEEPVQINIFSKAMEAFNAN